jgi:hypothetical protein
MPAIRRLANGVASTPTTMTTRSRRSPPTGLRTARIHCAGIARGSGYGRIDARRRRDAGLPPRRGSQCKIAEAINPRHYQTGFTTATCGTFAAAAASAKLLGLDAEATARALSIAGSQSAGLRENFGTMTKPFHAGRSSESGVAAAQFASYGWTATDRILEAPRGFFSAAGGGYDADAIAGKLGAPWTIANPGVSIKPHPSGRSASGMTEMMRLIRQRSGPRTAARRHQPQHAQRADPSPHERASASSRWSSAWPSCCPRDVGLANSLTRPCCADEGDDREDRFRRRLEPSCRLSQMTTLTISNSRTAAPLGRATSARRPADR